MGGEQAARGGTNVIDATTVWLNLQ